MFAIEERDHQRRFVAFATLLAFLAGLLAPLPSFADVHDGVFEVSDANAIQDDVERDDWENVFLEDSDADTAEFFTDPVNSASDDVFTTGKSKVDEDVSAWRHTTGSAPDKNDIMNAFAAAYLDGDDVRVYFGADRYANDGDAMLGFWFFQEPITKNSDGTFSGNHRVGDILIHSNFTSGGSVSVIEAYEWVGTDGDTGRNPKPLEKLVSGVDCSVAGSETPLCAIVNKQTEPSPWPFTPKSPDGSYDPVVEGYEDHFPTASFFEGGMNISELLPDAGVCVQSFMAFTRSSHSVTAQKKDFVIGEFDLCDLEVRKDGDDISKVGDETTYTVTVTNKGGRTLWLDSIDDDKLGDLLDETNENFEAGTYSNTCGASLAAGASCQISFAYVVQPGDGAPGDPFVNEVTAVYNEAENLQGLSVSHQDTHILDLFVPGLAVTKTGDTVLSKIGDEVTYTVTIENTSSSNSPDLVFVSIDDSLAGDLLTPDLEPGVSSFSSNCPSSLAPETTGTVVDTCTITYTYEIQEGALDQVENTVTVHTRPDGFPNDIIESDAWVVELFEPGVRIEKTGADLAQVGDTVTYDFKITNTSSSNTPTLILDSIIDDVLGDLETTATAAGCDTLGTDPPDDTCEFSVDWEVTVAEALLWPDGAEVTNTVTVVYNPDGFSNEITASDHHVLEVFQPDFVITKTGDDLSKVGDLVVYTFEVTNTSTTNTPTLLLVDIVDDVLGDLETTATIADCDALDPGGSCSFTVDYWVDMDHIDLETGHVINIVSATYRPDGFDGQQHLVVRVASHALDLFGPHYTITKAGPDRAHVGDTVTYTFTVENLSTDNSPDLELVSISDDVLGNLKTAADDAGCDVIAWDDEPCSFTVDWEVVVAESVLWPDGATVTNTVTAVYSPEDFPNLLERQDQHGLDVFEAKVEIVKTGAALAQIGDDVTYTFTITNVSTKNTPPLHLDDLDDDVLGDLTDDDGYDSDCDVLAVDATCTFTVTYTVDVADLDGGILAEDGATITNRVDVTYVPEGFENEASDWDDHELGIFWAGFDITKTGDDLSKAGDDVVYTFTVENLSTTNSPDLELATMVDDVLGDLTEWATYSDACDVLESGDTCSFSVTYTVDESDFDEPMTPDGTSLTNTVTGTYAPVGFGAIAESASHELDVFLPDYTIEKSGDVLTGAGDEIVFTFTITNLSTSNSPPLELVSFEDSVLGDLSTAATAAGCDVIAWDEECSFEVLWIAENDSDDPLSSTVTTVYSPAGFPNQLLRVSDHEVGVFAPSYNLEKTGATLSQVGEVVTYTFTVTNTSSANTPDLILTSVVDDVLGDVTAAAVAAGCDRIAVGESCSFDVDYTVRAGDFDDPMGEDGTTITNTVESVYRAEGFDNDLVEQAVHTLGVFEPSVTVVKDGPADAEVGDEVTFTFTVTNTSTSNSPDLELVSVVDVGVGWDGLGDLTEEAVAGGCGTLAVGESCTFTAVHTVGTDDPDPLANVVTVVFSPEGFETEVDASDDHELIVVEQAVLPRVIEQLPLPRTGMDVLLLLALALAALGLGSYLVRRSREEPDTAA